MKNVAVIVFLYYSSVWAVISTLMIHVTRQLHFSVTSIAYMMSGFGIATMISEAVLVRFIVPYLGEVYSIRIGLAAFTLQTICIAFSASPAMMVLSVSFSMLSHLVYPSVSSLVSRMVLESAQGEALGALNGIKALTEGFGPLVFGGLMFLFEDTPMPGAPYLLAAVVAAWALLHSYELPTDLDHLQLISYSTGVAAVALGSCTPQPNLFHNSNCKYNGQFCSDEMGGLLTTYADSNSHNAEDELMEM
jgi:MFS transporter, DHA1 family, tetracycline resistance protein